MAKLIAVRSVNRSKNIRIKNSAGTRVALSPTADTIIDVDDGAVRKALQYHSGLGNIVVTGTVPQTFTVATLPAANTVPAGTVVHVSDGGAGAVFRGSTGSAWVNLG